MEKFVSPEPEPSPEEREALEVLAEECAEVSQRAMKALRFGCAEVQPGQSLTNSERLSVELGDLFAAVELCQSYNLVSADRINAAKDAKPAKLRRYLQRARII